MINILKIIVSVILGGSVLFALFTEKNHNTAEIIGLVVMTVAIILMWN